MIHIPVLTIKLIVLLRVGVWVYDKVGFNYHVILLKVNHLGAIKLFINLN